MKRYHIIRVPNKQKFKKVFTYTRRWKLWRNSGKIHRFHCPHYYGINTIFPG